MEQTVAVGNSSPWTEGETHWFSTVWRDCGEAPEYVSQKCRCRKDMTSHATHNTGRRLHSGFVATATCQIGQKCGPVGTKPHLIWTLTKNSVDSQRQKWDFRKNLIETCLASSLNQAKIQRCSASFQKLCTLKQELNSGRKLAIDLELATKTVKDGTK